MAEDQVPPRRDQVPRPSWFEEAPEVPRSTYEPGTFAAWRVMVVVGLALVGLGSVVYFLSQLRHHEGNPFVTLDFIGLGLFLIALAGASWGVLRRR